MNIKRRFGPLLKKAVVAASAVTAVILSSCPAACTKGTKKKTTAQKPAGLAVPYITDRPSVDGKLDYALSLLPVFHFTTVRKSHDENQEVALHYRLAYHAEFLYLYIQVEQDHYVTRDRGYQNGDGFHMTLAIPRKDGMPSDEFYVMGFYPEENQEKIKKGKFVWYRNLDMAFTPLESARFEAKAHDGHVGFELLLPWKEAYPYHPWLTKTMGFNLCYVQAVGESEKNYYFVVYDERFQSEQSKRRYRPLTFLPSGKIEDLEAYAVLQKNHLVQGEKVRLHAVFASESKRNAGMKIVIESTQAGIIHEMEAVFSIGVGVTHAEKLLPTDGIAPGHYRIVWKLNAKNSEGTFGFTVLPPYDLQALSALLKSLAGTISEGSRTTCLFRIEEVGRQVSRLKPYDTAEAVLVDWQDLQHVLNEGAKGIDTIATQTGILRRAYRSEVDGTLQPYSVNIPEKLAAGTRVPLLVYLHGGGTDDRKQLTKPVIPEGMMALAPFGRGTSNAFSTDHAQDDIREAIDDVVRHYPIDPERIVLTGFSMGGYGVYRTFYEHPGRFIALAVFSGDPDLANKYFGGGHPNFMDVKYLAPFKDIPIFICHGEEDRNCPFEETKNLVEILKKVGALVEFHHEEGKGHKLPGEENLHLYFQWLEDVLL